MEQKAWMEEDLDLKRLFFLWKKKIVWIVVSAVVGAILFAIGYKTVTSVTDGEPLYQTTGDYYITFNFEEFENADDYYNAYTWDTILRQDILVDAALEQLPAGYTKEQIRESVAGEMLGDYRVLTVHVQNASAEVANAIAESYTMALENFPQKVDMLSQIECWNQIPAVVVAKHTKTANAALLGAILGFLAGFFWLAFTAVLNDTVYTLGDMKQYSDLLFLGYETLQQDEKESRLLEENITRMIGEQIPITYWNADTSLETVPFDALRDQQGLVMKLPFGKVTGKRLERILQQFALQGCSFKGCVITEVPDAFLKFYEQK
ncbi:MAG: hypothetical protein MJ134_02280 [Lachnospiraceae bacterium]|nr:hypothetical protein [Lachnospiraceae bacterium]